MLSYCMHVTFYLLLKAEGKKVAGHPVVNSLVEIRVYLEKMWPLEEKLQYSINRLISGNKTSAAPASELRPLSSDPTFSGASRGALSNETRERRRAIQQQKEAMELEREEQSAMVRVQSKKASALNKVSLDTNFSPLSYNEEADQYLTKITGQDSDEDEGLSLTEALRQRRAKMEQIQQSKKPKKAEVYIDDDEEDDTDDDDDEEFGEDEEGDFGEEDDDDGMDEEDLDALWEEEKRREEEEAQPTTREPFTVQEVDRRKATKKIESHRGLTKARPKDRKNPRVAQRRKYERGLQKHKAQSGKQHEPEPEGGFIGVRSLKTGVVKANRLQ
ncbi:U3 small nucleolar RNA-associated protein 3 [Angomonas deanei]|nr:U3 small nucleolar RNA-associated protein 3 [Angomonas deanei]|eukprot:EPY30145.1 U3 small nucleolar RNA-associated protein 3 [Angomonas deanei]